MYMVGFMRGEKGHLITGTDGDATELARFATSERIMQPWTAFEAGHRRETVSNSKA